MAPMQWMVIMMIVMRKCDNDGKRWAQSFVIDLSVCNDDGGGSGSSDNGGSGSGCGGGGFMVVVIKIPK